MSSPLKQLASETAIYGLSTILARIINFALVPVYTRVLTQGDYGVVTELMSWIGVLQVVLVLGLETGCFRYANKEGVDARKVFGNAFVAVFGVSAAFFALMLAFDDQIATLMGYANYGNVIRYMGGILALDAITAIIFSKLRQEHKALKFALVKTAKICTELGVNLYLFLVASKPEWIFRFVSETPDFSYVIFAIFVSCLLATLLLLPDIFKVSLRLDPKLLKEMLLYSLPLMVAALPGIVNDLLDRILFRWFDTSSEQWRDTLGVYQAAVKLSVIMNLCIQMFRYAAEPFFFQRAKEKGSKELYAKVMTYFVAFCCFVMLGVIYYMDILELLLGRDFRSAIGVVPIMLLGYIILGMLFNVNMWYKLSGKTSMAMWITLIGLAVTALVNVLFMPHISYWASAIGHLLSSLVMLIVSVALGNKYYPIPYQWKAIGLLFVVMALFYGLSLGSTALIDSSLANTSLDKSLAANTSLAMWLRLGVNTLLLLAYCAVNFLMLRKLGSPRRAKA